MISALRQRIARDEGGFTLIELLVVIIIIGILLAIAVPSYLSFRDRANQRAASANVRAAVPAAEAYFADNGTYATMSRAGLLAIDQGLSPEVEVAGVDGAAGTAPTDTAYCLQADVNGKQASYGIGIGATSGQMQETLCP